ncbi:MAG: TPM domain-containing protein [Morganella sp. (in: enterobacteria)]
MMRLVAGCLFLLFISLFARADGQPLPELKRERVIDSAGMLTKTQFTRLNRQLSDFEQQRGDGTQFVVFIISTTNGEDIDAFALRTFNTWKIGKKARDNGLLLVVSVDDRKLRFEVGYGLESILPDVVAGRIIRYRITPEFKNGNYFAGIEAGVTDAIAVINGNEPEYIQSNNQATEELKLKRLPVIYLFTFLIMYFWLLFSGTRRRKKQIQQEINMLTTDPVKRKGKNKRAAERSERIYLKRLTAILKHKYIYPRFPGLFISVMFYSVIIFLVTRLVIEETSDTDAVFMSSMILVFINVLASPVILLFLHALIPGYRIQSAEMQKIYGDSNAGSTSFSYSSGSSDSSGSGGGGSSSSSGGGGGSSGGGGASGSW